MRILVLLLVLGLLLVAAVVILYRRHKWQQAQRVAARLMDQARAARVHKLPETVQSDETEPAPAKVVEPPASVTPLPANEERDKAADRSALHRLNRVLQNSDGLQPHYETSGRFSRRDGCRFTVYHDGDLCVVVWVASSLHSNVSRMVCSLGAESWARFGRELREEPAGTHGIRTEQAKNTSVDGLKVMDRHAIGHLLEILNDHAYRLSSL